MILLIVAGSVAYLLLSLVNAKLFIKPMAGIDGDNFSDVGWAEGMVIGIYSLLWLPMLVVFIAALPFLLFGKLASKI